MARIVFTRTTDELTRGLLLGGGIGLLLAAIFWTPGRPDTVVVAMALFVPVAFFSLAGALMKSYRSACSDCNADLTLFVESPSDARIFHCPACGAKLTDPA